MTSFEVRRIGGSVAAIHGEPVDVEADVTVCWADFQESAMVLGSSQPDGIVDTAACQRAGVGVVRRRSGGGAVLLVPGEAVWLDVYVRAGCRLWVDDVGRAGWWLGDAVVRALDVRGMASLTVHRGAMVRRPLSSLVCFAGWGPGEVLTASGAKVVGTSQRRTRDVARFQLAAHLAWRAQLYEDLLTARPSAEDLGDVVEVVPATAAQLIDSLTEQIRVAAEAS